VDQTALKAKNKSAVVLANSASGTMTPNSITKAAGTAPDLTPPASLTPTASKTNLLAGVGGLDGKLGVVDKANLRDRAAALEAALEREKQLAAMVCSLENKDACLMCGS
jgi:hypothetical protein